MKLTDEEIMELPDEIQEAHVIADINSRYKVIEEAKKAGFNGLAAGMEFVINQPFKEKM